MRGQVFFSRGRCKCYRGLNVFRFEAWKIVQNVLGRIPLGETGEHGTQRDASTGEDGFTSADGGVSNDAFTVVHGVNTAPLRSPELSEPSLTLFAARFAGVNVEKG
jgi:hypothetical protein